MKFEERAVLKNTKDNWYGNYNGNQVLVKLIDLDDGEYCIWCEGTDDFALSRNFDNQEKAMNLFEQISQWEFVNHKDLYELCFSPD